MMPKKVVIVLTLAALSNAAMVSPMAKQDTIEPPASEPSTLSPIITSSAMTSPTTTELITSTDAVTNNPSTTTIKPSTEDPRICSQSTNTAVCLDCNKISVCLNERPLPGKDCPQQTPYCVNAESGSHCSAQPDPEKVQCQDRFQCTSQGYFPDPHDCHYFYVCDADLKPFKYDCMPGYVYDVNSNNCRWPGFLYECRKLDCSRSNGVWTYFGSNRQYYAYCYHTEVGRNEVAVFKCSDGATFDGIQCQYKCRGEGRFPDSQSKSRYFECYVSGLALRSRVKECSPGMVFDRERKMCVPQRRTVSG
ncbi:uncharacterized protein LOC129768658 [Toxorhynchites rutilus septentrionalis]|uniref:uncharacterized protein LOC129768658 n=1 Tax=Toxorhynchites rutilus septentrionalis TaxID=329112 RepID=UPI0024787E14|nr:uncharacterized protein LOC129768658 [Toxorhynchites rutilus septentrionalis]